MYRWETGSNEGIFVTQLKIKKEVVEWLHEHMNKWTNNEKISWQNEKLQAIIGTNDG